MNKVIYISIKLLIVFGRTRFFIIFHKKLSWGEQWGNEVKPMLVGLLLHLLLPLMMG